MLASIRSAAVLGIAAYDVTVEVDVATGLPKWTIVGLASSAVKEARERVSAALNNSGFALPSRRITVNLSPDNDAKERTHAPPSFLTNQLTGNAERASAQPAVPPIAPSVAEQKIGAVSLIPTMVPASTPESAQRLRRSRRPVRAVRTHRLPSTKSRSHR